MTDDLAIRRRRLLGWGWRLAPVTPHADLGLDLVLDSVEGDSTRLAEVSAADCVVQDLTVALTTPLGSSLFNSALGFDGLNALAFETDPVMQRERIRLAVIGVLQREARIARIDAVDVSYGDRASRQLRVDANFTLIDGSSAAVSTTPLWGLDVNA